MLKLIRAEWQLLLFGFLMTFWSAPGQTYFISLFSGEIRSELGLSDGEFASIYSLATLASAVVVVWTGSLVDRVELRRFSIALVLGVALGCGLMSISSGVVSLFASLFMLRQLGQGLMFITSSTVVVRYLESNKGKSNALAGLGYAASEALLPAALVVLLMWVGWRNSWQIIGITLLCIMVPAILYLLRSHQQRHHHYLLALSSDYSLQDSANRRRHWTRSEVLGDRLFYMFLPGLLSQPLMFTGFIFHQVHLVESKGWSLSAWAALFFVYALVSVGTKIISGYLVDRYSAIRLVPWLSIPMAIGLIALALSSNLFWGGVFLVLTGITVGLQTTVSAPFWSEMYGSRYLGSIKSMGAAAMVLSTALSPLVIGWGIDFGISLESMAVWSAVYILLTSSLAAYACHLKSKTLR